MSRKKGGAPIPQSGVVPYRHGARGIEILLMTTRSGKRWSVPKGMIEPSLSVTASAAKEGFEEAGVEGLVFERKIGTYRYSKKGRIWKVELYPMKVTHQHVDWPEANWRTREWLTVRDAAHRVSMGELAHHLLKLPVWLRNSAPDLRAIPVLGELPLKAA